MRDLEMEELTHVYGAGGRGRSPCPPSNPPRCGRGGKSGSKGRGSKGRGSGSGRGKRCRGGSS